MGVGVISLCEGHGLVKSVFVDPERDYSIKNRDFIYGKIIVSD